MKKSTMRISRDNRGSRRPHRLRPAILASARFQAARSAFMSARSAARSSAAIRWPVLVIGGAAGAATGALTSPKDINLDHRD